MDLLPAPEAVAAVGRRAQLRVRTEEEAVPVPAGPLAVDTVLVLAAMAGLRGVRSHRGDIVPPILLPVLALPGVAVV